MSSLFSLEAHIQLYVVKGDNASTPLSVTPSLTPRQCHLERSRMGLVTISPKL